MPNYTVPLVTMSKRMFNNLQLIIMHELGQQPLASTVLMTPDSGGMYGRRPDTYYQITIHVFICPIRTLKPLPSAEADAAYSVRNLHFDNGDVLQR